MTSMDEVITCTEEKKKLQVIDKKSPFVKELKKYIVRHGKFMYLGADTSKDMYGRIKGNYKLRVQGSIVLAIDIINLFEDNDLRPLILSLIKSKKSFCICAMNAESVKYITNFGELEETGNERMVYRHYKVKDGMEFVIDSHVEKFGELLSQEVKMTMDIMEDSINNAEFKIEISMTQDYMRAMTFVVLVSSVIAIMLTFIFLR